VRFRTRTLQPIRIAASVLVSLLLASCISYTGTVPYPASWAPVRQGQAVGSCPKIDGVYWDRGQYQPTPYVSGRPCDFKTGECTSLIFGLVSDAQSAIRIGGFNWRSTVQQVQIEQPSPGVVEIIAEPGGKRQTLSMANGDFTCDKNGLRLRDTTAATIVLISNALSTESRIFNVADDGSLIMKSVWHNRGNHTLFPFSVTNELLVRWTRVDPEHSGSQTVITPLPDE
jgi:hypothetical protein